MWTTSSAKGRDLWKSDEEFDRFLEDIRRSRHGLDSASREDLEKELAMRDAKRQTPRRKKQSNTGRRSKNRPTKTLEELAREQGITLPMNIDELTGMGKDLWASDEELDRFLADIYKRRKELDA